MLNNTGNEDESAEVAREKKDCLFGSFLGPAQARANRATHLRHELLESFEITACGDDRFRTTVQSQKSASNRLSSPSVNF